jgi:2-polyprenyl-3-methyl-5-hydroxy-6-metoxy-1,4-benzoquinol methylase
MRFDEKAAEWDANPARVALARAVVDSIRAAVPLRPDVRVLDFGAGTGLVSLGLLPFVGEVTAMDASDGSFHADKTGVSHNGFDRTTLCCWLNETGFADVVFHEAYRIKRLGSDGTPHTYPVFLVTARMG